VYFVCVLCVCFVCVFCVYVSVGLTGGIIILCINLGINFSVLSQQVSTICVVIVGVYLISEGEMTVGALIACTILTGRALAPISQAAGLLTRYHQAMNSLDSISQVMTLPVDRPTGKQYLNRSELQGGIQFKEVSMTYPGEQRPVLNKVSLKIKPKEHIALLGRVGSGKTSFAKLIMSLYDPNEGSILLDGTDLSQIDPAKLRHQIGYVSQDVVLFYGSIRENINIGTVRVDDALILEAARIVGIDTFINQHPMGFDMPVGERGCNLSGGQRQMIAIARALVYNPPVLILDEPSTAMDERTEAIFRHNLKEYAKDKTLLLITHKASMLQLTDRIIVFDQGAVVADGPKDAVVKALAEGKVKIARS